MNINEELLKLQENSNLLDFGNLYIWVVILIGWVIFSVLTINKWMDIESFYENEIRYIKKELNNINEEDYIKNDKDTHILDEINNEYKNSNLKLIYENKLKKYELVFKGLSNNFISVVYVLFCASIGIYLLISIINGYNDKLEYVGNKQEEKLIELIAENKKEINISYIESVGVNNYKLGYYIDNEYNEMSYAESIIFQEGSNIILEKFEEVNKEDLDNTYIGNFYSSDISFAKFKHKISKNSKLYVGNIHEEELINNGKISLLKNNKKDELK